MGEYQGLWNLYHLCLLHVEKTQISRVIILFIRFAPEKQTVGANAQEKQLQVKQSWGLRRVYEVGRPQWPINWLCLPRVGRLPWLRASPADKVRPSAGGLGPNLPRFPIYTHSHRSPGFKRKYWNIKETKIDKEVETRFDQFAVFVQTTDGHQPKVIPNYILFFLKQNTNVFSSALSCLLWLLNVKEGLWLLKGWMTAGWSQDN